MDHLDDVGEITFSLNRVHWRIPNYYSFPQKVSTIISSPRFLFIGRHWKMFVYPNGCHWDSSSGWLGISVFDESFCFGSREMLNVRLGITGQIEESVVSSVANPEGDGNYHLLRLIRRSVLQSNKDHMVPRDSLHLFLIIENETVDIAVNSTMPEKEEESKKISEEITSNITMDLPLQSEADIGVKKLQQDLKEILLSENVSDITLKVKDREFKTHRSILAARSAVFMAMMRHDTKEKTTGVVDIEDSDPDTFLDFLLYLYTGNLEHLTIENAPSLYVTADKYEVNELKNACIKCMLENVSIKNFPDILSLSFRHNEKELSDGCIHFFVDHSLEIVMTSKWQEFLIENPVVGNELFIKRLQMMKSQ